MMPAGLPHQRGPRKATISNQYIKPICSQYVMFLSFFICCSWIITAFYAFYMVSFRFRGNTMAFRLLWAWGWGWVEVVVEDGCFCKFQHIFGMIFPQNNPFMVLGVSHVFSSTPLPLLGFTAGNLPWCLRTKHRGTSFQLLIDDFTRDP